MAKTLNDYAVGDIVKIPEGSAASGGARLVPYIIVHKGKPSSLYDDSCNGVWLLRQDILENRAWNTNNVNNYAASTIHAYLNGDFVNNYLTYWGLNQIVKQVKIPYAESGADSATIHSGANGLQAKVFLLAGCEIGWKGYYTLPQDGDKLDYFDAGTGSAANAKRIANWNGSASFWYMRSPTATDAYETTGVTACYTSGVMTYYSSCSASTTSGIRPAFILPYNAVVDDSDYVTGELYETPVGIRIGVNNVSRNIGKAYVGIPSATLTNLMPAINGTSGWEATSGSMTTSTAYRKYSTTTFGLVGSTSLPESHAATTANIPLIAGHKYYIRYEVYFVSANTRRTTIYWPIAEPNVYNSNYYGVSIPANTWKALSIVTDRGAAGHASGNYPFRVDFDHSYSTGTMYVDGIMVIDLTAAFGSGKEPTTAWCDANIPYFTGTKEIAADGVTGKARKIIKGYMGVDNVARLVFEN